MLPCPPSTSCTLPKPGNRWGKSSQVPHTLDTTILYPPAGATEPCKPNYKTNEPLLSFHHPYKQLTLICYAIATLVSTVIITPCFTSTNTVLYKHLYITISFPYVMHNIVVYTTTHTCPLCVLSVFYIICILLLYKLCI